jgi:hypothetical protein
MFTWSWSLVIFQKQASIKVGRYFIYTNYKYRILSMYWSFIIQYNIQVALTTKLTDIYAQLLIYVKVLFKLLLLRRNEYKMNKNII